MNREAHMAKAARIEATLAKLQPQDYEIRIDGAMLAANHYANMALHILGICPEKWDMIHSEYLTVIDYTRFRILAGDLLAALDGIEELRAPFVRGGADGGEQAGEEAMRLLAKARTAALAVKPTGIPIVNYTPHA